MCFLGTMDPWGVALQDRALLDPLPGVAVGEGIVVGDRVRPDWPWVLVLACQVFLAGWGQGSRTRGLDLCGQATKGAWGMSWRQEALKGVEDCEKLGGIVKRVLIPRFPNRHALNS